MDLHSELKLFLVGAHVTRGSANWWPDGMCGGILPIFVWAATVVSAEHSARIGVDSMGLEFVGLVGPSSEIEPETFPEFVASRWPGAEHLFPSQSVIAEGRFTHSIAIGPLAAYTVS
jgi:hypothetical protein